MLLMYQHYVKTFGYEEGRKKVKEMFDGMGAKAHWFDDIADCFNKEGHAIGGTNAVTTFTFE
jgi:hypothetical protein